MSIPANVVPYKMECSKRIVVANSFNHIFDYLHGGRSIPIAVDTYHTVLDEDGNIREIPIYVVLSDFDTELDAQNLVSSGLDAEFEVHSLSEISPSVRLAMVTVPQTDREYIEKAEAFMAFDWEKCTLFRKFGIMPCIVSSDELKQIDVSCIVQAKLCNRCSGTGVKREDCMLGICKECEGVGYTERHATVSEIHNQLRHNVYLALRETSSPIQVEEDTWNCHLQ